MLLGIQNRLLQLAQEDFFLRKESPIACFKAMATELYFLSFSQIFIFQIFNNSESITLGQRERTKTKMG